jgi:integrase
MVDMRKVNFTVERIAAFQCESNKRQTIFWDAKTPGLGLRVTAGGSKSFIFETRLHGKTLRLTIGNIRTWLLGNAQKEATRLKESTDRGIDPRQQVAEQRLKAQAAQVEAKRRHLTLGDVWPIYLEARKARWGDRHYQDHVKLSALGGATKKRGNGLTKAAVMAPLMPLLLSELTGSQIAAWLQAEAVARPTNAALAFRLLRAFVAWAADIPAYRDIVPPDACSARTVRDALPKSRAKEGDCLQREQLPAWFDAVRKLHSPVISTYLQALLLTGARREELAGLRWQDVDFQWRSLSIRDKVDGIRVIPLTPYLASLLLNLKRMNDTPPRIKKIKGGDIEQPPPWQPAPWVFSSPAAESGRLTEPRIAHNGALQAAGLPHVTLHGLRRSFGTLCEWVEVPSGISAQIMGHKPSAVVEKHYRRRPLDLLRKWHDTIEAWILKEAGIDFVAAEPALRVVA